MEAEQETLTSWQRLPDDKRAFVAAYVEEGYSTARAAEVLGLPVATSRKFLADSDVRVAVTEVQAAKGEIEFLNETWVKEQLLRLFPKVMGEESVPYVTSMGEQVEAKKFYPDIAMRVLEYVAPKKTQAAININVDNSVRLTDAQLEKIARRGAGVTYENG